MVQITTMVAACKISSKFFCNLTDEDTFNLLSIDFVFQFIVFKLICVKYLGTFTLLLICVRNDL